MNILKNLFAICMVLLMCCGCGEEFVHMPVEEGGPAPAPVTNIEVENKHGGALLNYSVPDDDNLLYVKAVYEYPKGHVRDVKASSFVDSLVISGIGNVNELEVKLYSVSPGEVMSEPVIVEINPLTPPVQLVRTSLTMEEDFGGVTVKFKNEIEENIVITILLKDSLGDWNPIEALYTKQKMGDFSARGQKAEPQEFGVFVKDRWNNVSDTMILTLTPIFEIMLPYPTPVSSLAGDCNTFYRAHYSYEAMFDESFHDTQGLMGTRNGTGIPQSFTLDFGVPTKFSRFKLWMRGILTNQSYLYNHTAPEVWEIWGSNELNDDWSKWTKIDDFTAVKPSGLPLGQVSDEDVALAKAGLDFNFPPGTPAYRYIRWKTNKVFGGSTNVQILELNLWGSQ